MMRAEYYIAYPYKVQSKRTVEPKPDVNFAYYKMHANRKPLRGNGNFSALVRHSWYAEQCVMWRVGGFIIGGIILIGEAKNTRTKPCLSATSSPTYTTWTCIRNATDFIPLPPPSNRSPMFHIHLPPDKTLPYILTKRPSLSDVLHKGFQLRRKGHVFKCKPT